jgi:transcriptional regulator with XRE-family HTH domain
MQAQTLCHETRLCEPSTVKPDATPHTLRVLVGREMREVRERAGMRQEDIARIAFEIFGLRWTASRITALEAGQKAISAEELLVLARLADGLDDEPPRGIARFLPREGRVKITDLWVPDAAEVREVAIPTGKEPRPERFGLRKVVASAVLPHLLARERKPGGHMRYVVPDVADYRAAKRLGVRPADVIDAADALGWGSLSAHRDLLVAERSAPGDTPERVKALRGRVTRDLDEKLAREIEFRANGPRRSAGSAGTSGDPNQLRED